MLFTYDAETRTFFADGTPAAEFLLPVYRESEADGDGIAVTAESPYAVDLAVEQDGGGHFLCRMAWTNRTDVPRRWQGAVTLRAVFGAERYLIPCVSMDGNRWGAGLEPKGLTRDGRRWIFAYDREAIPACTVVENADLALSLFAADCDADSLASACCVYVEGGQYHQQLWYPVREAPVTYAGRDKYAEGYETWCTIAPGETVVLTFHLILSRPRWANYGICDTLDAALDLFPGEPAPAPDPDRLWRDSIAFARSLITHYTCANGTKKKGFIIGFTPTEAGFAYRGDNCFELGWCGQNVLFSRMLIEDCRRTGNRQNLDDALEILDTRVACCTAPSGLLAAQLRHCENLTEASADTCNMGYGAYELIRVWRALRDLGIERPAYFAAARGLCDFFAAHCSPVFAFGKQWRLDGTCLDEGGTIGAFVILPLCEMYRETGEAKYLDTAKRAAAFYAERDLDRFVCTAGALDTCCVDKETATPLLIAGLQLWGITRERRWLEMAEKAAYYFTAWMYHYEPIYPADCDISRYGVRVKGMTAVSAQHHHLDEYGLLLVPYLYRLADETGDGRWHIRADWMWRGANQYVSDGTLEMHGRRRAPGAQNEALFHCRWIFSKNCGRGDLNDWLVAWPCAYRLSVLAEGLQ